jgi:hypothetical protein
MSDFDIFSEIYEQDDEDDYDTDNDLTYYLGNEPSLTRFNIVLCELHNEKIHGLLNNSYVKYFYLVNQRFKTLKMSVIEQHIFLSKHWISHNLRVVENHSIFKNYKNIVLRENYYKPEIAECFYLETTQECVAILKTFWIKIIQRKWKTIFKLRKEILKKRCNINFLKFRENTGNWPNECFHFPQLQGMLSNLKN